MFNEGKGKREFQSGLDPKEQRRARQDDRLSLRRANRENRLMRKRQVLQDRKQTTNKTDQISQNQRTGSQSQPNEESSLSSLHRYVQGCFSDHPATQFECTQFIRQLLSRDVSPPIDEVVSSGVVPRLIQFLHRDNMPRLQFEASWALTNIASGAPEHTAVIIRNGAISLFVKLLDSPSDEVRELSAWCLGNISGDSPECRDLVLSHGALTKVVEQIKSNESNGNQFPENELPISLLRTYTWTLTNFCRGKPTADWKYIVEALEGLCIAIMMDDEEILTDCCWGLQYAIDVTCTERQQFERFLLIGKSGALKRLIDLLSHENHHVAHPAVRAIGSMLSGTDQEAQFTLELGVLSKMAGLLASQTTSAIRREVVWSISNITAGTEQQIDAVMNANLLQPLIMCLEKDRADAARESLWAIANAISGGSDKVVTFLVRHGVIGPLFRFLKNTSKTNIMIIALEAIGKLLEAGKRMSEIDGHGIGFNQIADLVEECGGIDVFETLQGNETLDERVYEKIMELMLKYWDEDQEEGDMNEIVLPPAQVSGNTFGFGSAPRRASGGGDGFSF